MLTCANCSTENPDRARFCLACGTLLQTAVAGESRRLVTIVFCDLEDSTPLATRLDAESLRKIVTRYFEEMSDVLERHGGTVEKFIGDAVMAVFGVPTLHDDDALRAVRAAMDMHDAFEVLNDELERDWGVRLRHRVGVNTGEVVAGDAFGGQTFVTGEAVHIASRLEGAAQPGTILLGNDTHRLVRDAVTTEEVELFGLKGLGDVRAHRLLAVIPGAAGHTRRLDSPFVDRERETALLRDAFERMLDGRRRQMVTVLGAAGVGKSRLVDELLRTAEGRATSYRGRCLAYGEGITFWPIVDVVTQAAGLVNDDTMEAARGNIAGLLSTEHDDPIVAERVSQAIGIGGAPGAPEETFWAIRTFFEALARRHPLILVFDDIQWGEPTFLELIAHDRLRRKSPEGPPRGLQHVCYPFPTMAAVCDICGKKPFFGKSVTFSHKRNNRRWNPNIQKVRALVDGTPRRLHVCTSCIKAGKVTRIPHRAA